LGPVVETVSSSVAKQAKVAKAKEKPSKE